MARTRPTCRLIEQVGGAGGAARPSPPTTRIDGALAVHGRRATVGACPRLGSTRRWLLIIAFAARSSAWSASSPRRLCPTGGSPPTSSMPCNGGDRFDRPRLSLLGTTADHYAECVAVMIGLGDQPGNLVEACTAPRRTAASGRSSSSSTSPDRRAAAAVGLHALLARLRRVHPASAGDLRVVGTRCWPSPPGLSIRRLRRSVASLRVSRDGRDPRARAVDDRHDRRRLVDRPAPGWHRGAAEVDLSRRRAPTDPGR